MRRIVPALAIAVAVLLSAGCDDDDDDPMLFATLTGEAEVPGPGDPDGSGSADLTFDEDEGEVCFDIEVTGIDPVTAAHIHRGVEGEAGPIVVGLVADSGPLSGCTRDVDPALINEILGNPAAFYVNVHNVPFPDGALRGQLRE